MKLSIAFPSIAALVLPCIVVADDRHVARFDVTKLFPDIDFRVDADPAFQSSTSDDNLSRVRGYSDGRTYGTAFVYPSLIKKINHATNQDVSVDKDASFHKVQMLHMTQSSHRHVDGVREVVGSSIRLNPLKKWEATTAFYVQEASPDSYFETDDDELCIPFLEGTAVYFNGALPHHSVLKSGSVKLLGPFQLSSLKSVGYRFVQCDPSLPCGPGQELWSCPCLPGSSVPVPSLGKSSKSTAVSTSGIPICEYWDDDINWYVECCGDDYQPCWAVAYEDNWIFPYYGCGDQGRGDGGALGPACCGFNAPDKCNGQTCIDYNYPPCGSVSVNGKSGKANSLASTSICGNPGGIGLNPPCCGFENYPPCEGVQEPCGYGGYPPCPSSNGLSGKSGKTYGNVVTAGYYPSSFYERTATATESLSQGHNHNGRPARGDHTSTAELEMEQLSAEIDGAVEEAVEQMVNIGELNVYESSVNVYKYGKDGEGDVVNVVASGDN